MKPRKAALSILELVVCMAIVGVIAVVAISRAGRGVRGAETAILTADLLVLRNAIDAFAAEHGGMFPSADDFTDQLLAYTDAGGDSYLFRNATHIFGPYLRAIPPLPVGVRKGNVRVCRTISADSGWIYDETTGEIRTATTTETDDSGKLYLEY